ncbi:DNA-binding IclR family transcriptional regulator [Nocardioides sp. J9]|uniref:helix-turn-helix domain-containing protein n=1 Tax=unclassified Nocardioides TaxID=2615069 RepID=UPI0004AE64B6|nr:MULTISPECIES: helix-turn-helix domain-containing protein [unclassified Nocardioides]TWG96786.1 DNA-binding IclR family transcriptional regulator [Nocardioides sp. J9]
MTASPSPPTTRVVDVLELVAARRDRPLRAADVARELGLSRATTHAIVHTLAARGWLVRSPDTGHLALGPALGPVAAAVAEQRTGTRLGVRAAAGLASATGWPASVVELVDDVLYVSSVDPDDLTVMRGQRLPYAAPFGTLFAAWAEPDERRGWLRRGRLTEAAVASYGAHLDQARADGFLVERMSPVVEHVSSLVQATHEGDFPAAVHELAGELLAEVVRTSMETHDAASQPVTSVAAPVPGPDGTVRTALVVHPLRDLTGAEVRRAASMVRQAAKAVVG